MLSIKILGSGCANCKRLAAVTEQAVARLSIQANVEKVTDYTEIMKYPILSTPALVIDEKVVSSGRIPGEDELSAFLTAALGTN